MKVALVHDYLVQYGGAERVLECFSEIFPRAPIYTLVYDQKSLHHAFGDKDIRTSFLQKIPLASSEHRLFPVFMPMAIEQFDLSYYDLVLSDSSSFAKGVITRPDTLHICYCHTPMRYAWDDCHKYTREFYFPSYVKKIIPFIMNYVRVWDRVAARRVDRFIANSNLVRKRIKKYYQENAKLIYPPVFLENFKPAEKEADQGAGKYFLMVGRLVPYKKFDLGVRVFNKLGLPLKIVGDGPEYKSLKKIAKENIEFTGSMKSSGGDLVKAYQGCKALLYPQEEDFGLVPLEAMACGKPVIAFRAGGALETVIEGKTGIFFDHQRPEDLRRAVLAFEKSNFNTGEIRRHAEGFNKDRFKKEITDYIEKELSAYKKEINGTLGAC